MLVLSRRVGEKIVIECDGKAIAIEVVEVRGDKVRLGIDAERSVAIYRAELLEKPQPKGKVGR
jgi:carbon storage regulator